MDNKKLTDEKPTILIIDGDDVMIKYLHHIYADLDYHLIGCTDPLEAVQLARSERPDVIIIDPLDSPWGVDVCWELQHSPPTHVTPFICIASLWCVGYDVMLTGLEFTNLVPKPFNPDDLREAVQTALDTPAQSLPRTKIPMFHPDSGFGGSLRLNALQEKRNREVDAEPPQKD